MASRHDEEITMPGGGHPPVSHASGKPYPRAEFPTTTVARLRTVAIRMRLDQRKIERAIRILPITRGCDSRRRRGSEIYFFEDCFA